MICPVACEHVLGRSQSSQCSAYSRSASLTQPAPRKPLRPASWTSSRRTIHSSTQSRRRRAFSVRAIWHVGSKQQYKTFSSISRKLHDGDVVEINSGTYGCTEQSIVWTANNITVIGVDGRATFNATGCVITGDKGIFNPGGTNMIIDNIAFIGVQGPSRNDAGIRLDGGGYVYITNSYFENSQNGVLLTPGVPTNIVIDHSQFSGNGNCLDASGCGHNMYISNGTNSTVSCCGSAIRTMQTPVTR